MDPADIDEEAWCRGRREDVARYLRQQGIAHGAIGVVPAWYVAPHASVWAVEPWNAPGWVGFWVISGDLPTDYCTAEDCNHPRVAIKRIAERWAAAIAQTKPGDATIGEMGLPAAALPLLKTRADLLLAMCADDEAWTEVGE